MSEPRPQYYESGARDAQNRLIWYPVPKPVPLHRVMVGMLCNALAYTDGSKTQAAKLLGISTHVLGQLLRFHGVPHELTRQRPAKRVPIVALLLLLVGLVLPAALGAQVPPVPADPVSATVNVLPAGPDWTVPPLVTRATPISATSANCNQPPPPVAPLPIVNPTTAVVDDPWHAGKVCRLLLPPVPMVGTGFRVTVQFTALPGTSCVDPTGTIPVPCLSALAQAPDPFGIAALKLRPAGPTGVALRP